MKAPDNHAIQLFENQKIRVAWDAEREDGTSPSWMWSAF